MEAKKSIFKEITPLTPDDCFKVFNRRKAAFDYPLHYHAEYELNYIRNAHGALRIVGDHCSTISDHELVLVGPNLYHGWEQGNCRSNDIHEVTIQFHDDLFPDTLLKRNVMLNIRNMLDLSRHGITFSQVATERIGSHIESLSVRDGFHSFLEFISILDALSNPLNHKQLSEKTGSSGFIGSRKLRDVYNYIHQHLNEKIKLEDIAGSMNMTSITFCRFIKSQTGKPFVTFLNELRVGNAARMLIETVDNILDIAIACGFNNQANFNRVFKRIKGCTPKDFRKNSAGIKRIV